ncbi:MAG TPA: dihydroorotate dehydrogenase electron transfer subunit, partial [bacterium]|nr:dihydroorotate dehydrogenase electron transfer subunit [bacterium]
PLADELPSLDQPALFACGPHGLLEAVAKIGLSRGVPTELSMEAMMACGIGVCQGCVCRDKEGNYVRTCREGPVFDAKELTWE